MTPTLEHLYRFDVDICDDYMIHDHVADPKMSRGGIVKFQGAKKCMNELINIMIIRFVPK